MSLNRTPLTCRLLCQARTKEEAEYSKYVLNLYAMVFNYEFSKGTDIDKVLNRFLDQLGLQVGWTDQAVAFARQLLTMVLVKIGNGLKRWARAYNRDEWDNLYKFTAVIEDFMFYRPVATIATPASASRTPPPPAHHRDASAIRRPSLYQCACLRLAAWCAPTHLSACRLCQTIPRSSTCRRCCWTRSTTCRWPR